MLRNVLPLLEVNIFATTPSTVAQSLMCASAFVRRNNIRGLSVSAIKEEHRRNNDKGQKGTGNGSLVSQAYQSFRALGASPPRLSRAFSRRLNISGSNRRVSPQTRSILSPFSLPAPARQPAQDLMFSESQDLSRQRFFDPSSEEAHHDIRMLGRDSV